MLPQKKHIFKISPSNNVFKKLLPDVIKNKTWKYILKIAPSKNIFLKLLPRKIYFQNCFLKKYLLNSALSKNDFFQNYSLEKITKKLITQIIKNKFENTFLKNTFSKLLPQKMHFQNCSLKKILFQNISLKKVIFEIAPSKKHFQNCSIKKTQFFKIAFSNYSLEEDIFKKCIFKIAFSKNINLVVLIRIIIIIGRTF